MLKEYMAFRNESEAELIEKKSRFIAAGKAVRTQEEAEGFLESRRLLHKTARHTAFAYRLERLERMSDDGEPQGTAGAPILNLLKGEGVFNSCIAVTRYFGGTLLGTGGLVRAYGGAAKLCLKGNLSRFILCKTISVRADYTYAGKIQYLAGKADLLAMEPSYTDAVQFSFIIASKDSNGFCAKIMECSNGSAKIDVVEEVHHSYPFN
jgi:uncharacterized YigZ family protein